MNSAKKAAIGIVVAAGLVGALSFLLPAPKLNTTAGDTTLLIVLPMAFTVLHFGALPFFIGGLKSFKSDMRRAYLLICLGIVTFSVAQLQVPLFSILNMWQSPWVTSGLIGIPYLLPGILLYMGARRFDIVLGVRERTKSVWLVLGVAVAAVLISIVLPHKDILAPDELSYDANTAIIVWSMVWYAAATMVLLPVQRMIGALYHTAMAWLVLAFLILFVATFQLFVFQQVGYANWYATYFSLLPYVFSGLAFMRAAYSFYEVSKY